MNDALKITWRAAAATVIDMHTRRRKETAPSPRNNISPRFDLYVDHLLARLNVRKRFQKDIWGLQTMIKKQDDLI